MRAKTLDAAVDLATDGESAAIDLSVNNHPFMPGATAVVVLASADLAGDAVFGLLGSNDGGDTFTQLTDVNGDNVEINATGTFFFEVVLPEQIQTTVVETTGAGVGQAVLLGN